MSVGYGVAMVHVRRIGEQTPKRSIHQIELSLALPAMRHQEQQLKPNAWLDVCTHGVVRDEAHHARFLKTLERNPLSDKIWELNACDMSP